MVRDGDTAHIFLSGARRVRYYASGASWSKLEIGSPESSHLPTVFFLTPPCLACAEKKKHKRY